MHTSFIIYQMKFKIYPNKSIFLLIHWIWRTSFWQRRLSHIPCLFFQFAGDAVNVRMSCAGSHMRRQRDKCVFMLYIDAVSLSNSKGQSNVVSSGMAAAQAGGVEMEFSVKELYAIEEIHSESNLLRLITGLVFSFCCCIVFFLWFFPLRSSGTDCCFLFIFLIHFLHSHAPPSVPHGFVCCLLVVWLQTEVCECRLGLQPRLYASSVCDA